jgi:hypothetical protein
MNGRLQVKLNYRPLRFINGIRKSHRKWYTRTVNLMLFRSHMESCFALIQLQPAAIDRLSPSLMKCVSKRTQGKQKYQKQEGEAKTSFSLTPRIGAVVGSLSIEASFGTFGFLANTSISEVPPSLHTSTFPPHRYKVSGNLWANSLDLNTSYLDLPEFLCCHP